MFHPAGLGCPVERVFEWLTEEPLASASLGQVSWWCTQPVQVQAQSRMHIVGWCLQHISGRLYRKDVLQVVCLHLVMLVGGTMRSTPVHCKLAPLHVSSHVHPAFHMCSNSPQVYRGELRPEWGGGQVAVKVQRPGVLEAVALDIYIMRRAAEIFSKLPGVRRARVPASSLLGAGM